MHRTDRPICVALLCIFTGCPGLFAADAGENVSAVEEVQAGRDGVAIDFNRDVRSILSDKCFHCHGPDASNQESGFRLDSRENVFADLGGYFAVVPGKPEQSELHARVRSTDDSDRMPPPDSNRTLTTTEKDILDRWIEQGAPYAKHWAFDRIGQPELPVIAPATPWGHNEIDSFVLARLRQQNLTPSPETDLLTLYRRACLTLTGLPPTPEQIRMLTSDPSENRYENAVDRLLQSIHYAERQALRWLDAARFADTDGYQTDAERSNWPWRDWVIAAFNDNMPFDQFVIEQVAGDMLPEASESQLLASAFNRNHRQNAEGGALAAEFLVENIIDRVETTSTVFLGLTMGCCRCHDHKYDPLSQEEFYQFYGYFNNIGESGIGTGVAANPVRKMASPLATMPAELSEQLASAEADFSRAKETAQDRMESWIVEKRAELESAAPVWRIANVQSAEIDSDKAVLEKQEDESWRLSGKGLAKASYTFDIEGDGQTLSAIRLDALPDDAFSGPRKGSYSVNGNFVLTEFKASLVSAGDDADSKTTPIKIREAVASFEQNGYPASAAIDGNAQSGWAIHDNQPIESLSAMFVLDSPIELTGDDRLRVVLEHHSQFADHCIGRLRLSSTDAASPTLGEKGLDANLLAAINKNVDQRTEADTRMLSDAFAKADAILIDAEKRLTGIQKTIDQDGYGKVSVMVMSERAGKPAPIYLLNRGQYNEPDKSRELQRGLPAALFDAKVQPSNRLELARWLVSPDNPLTARVSVNRIWQDHFGVGLVKTSEDFGLQGEIPSHPELLDWLSTHFIESGWDVKALHRLIVTSATYRQSSKVTAEMMDADPENRLLARGPRYRMDGFSIRDAALQAAGLMNNRVGGPPVKPYQPEGLWNVVASGAGTRYKPDQGDKLYRKSLYTYWKRAVNPPRQIIFDAGTREVCNVRTRVTNTPLQALVLMNDPTFWEAARHLAQRTLKRNPATANADSADEQPAPDDEARLRDAYQRVTGRDADAETVQILRSSLDYYRSHFAATPENATQLLSVGQSPRDASLDSVEHAAWTAVAHILLNLDETITIE